MYRENDHLLVEAFTDVDWVSSPSDRKSTTGYCTFLCGNLVCWKSKKHTVFPRSTAEAKYRVMVYTSCELMWMRHLLEELCFEVKLPMSMYCDNQAIHIASILAFHERTKHIEVDCHLIRVRVEKSIIATLFVST